MNESDARAHFRAMGIVRPSQCLIDAWLRAAELERQLAEADKPAASKANETVAAPTASQPDPVAPDEPAETARPGKSLLEPILRERGDLPQPSKRRKPGRPRIVASWFPAVAKTMADGTTLRMALLLNSIRLDAREICRLYRLVEFRRLYRVERRMYQLQKWGRIPPDELERARKRLLARIL